MTPLPQVPTKEKTLTGGPALLVIRRILPETEEKFTGKRPSHVCGENEEGHPLLHIRL